MSGTLLNQDMSGIMAWEFHKTRMLLLVSDKNSLKRKVYKLKQTDTLGTLEEELNMLCKESLHWPLFQERSLCCTKCMFDLQSTQCIVNRTLRRDGRENPSSSKSKR